MLATTEPASGYQADAKKKQICSVSQRWQI
jgi:hypothetical protein